MSKPDRPQDIDPNWGTATLGVRAGEMRSEFGEHSAAIHATSSFVFESAEAAAKRFSGEEPGLIYSRFTNPTVQGFERKLALRTFSRARKGILSKLLSFSELSFGF